MSYPRSLARRLLPRRDSPSKGELKLQQQAACREFLERHAEVAAHFPVQDAVARAKRTGDREVAAESRTVDLLRTRFARTIEFTRTHAPVAFDRGSSVLDAGAADGVYLRALGKDGTGLNIDRTAVDTMLSEGVRGVVASIHEMPFEDGRFDVALCLEVLEHLENPIGALRELARVTAGPAIITIPHVAATRVRPLGYWVQGQGEPVLDRRAQAHGYHVYEFSHEDFTSVASHAGWRIAASEPVIPFEPMPKWWLIALARGETG
jgi:SAM-dependent methyltransferase